MTSAFPYLLLPVFLSSANRARRRERGDGMRALVFGVIGLLVSSSIFAVVFWLTWRLLDYEELGAYLIRLGLSWLFLTFLSLVLVGLRILSLRSGSTGLTVRFTLPARAGRPLAIGVVLGLCFLSLTCSNRRSICGAGLIESAKYDPAPIKSAARPAAVSLFLVPVSMVTTSVCYE